MFFSEKFKDIFNQWLNILMEKGLKKDEAENILIWIFSDNRFMTDIIDVDIVREILNDVDLKDFGIDDAKIKEKMIEALKKVIGTKCPKCGALVLGDLRFCSNCGLPIDSPELFSIEQIPALRSASPSAIRGKIERPVLLEDRIIHETFEEFKGEFEDILKERPEFEELIKTFAKTLIGKYKSIKY